MRPLPKPTVPPAKWPLGRWVPQSAGKSIYNREEREALARGFIAHMDHHLFDGAIDRWYCERGFSGIAIHALNIEDKPTLGCAYPSKGVVILLKDSKKTTEREWYDTVAHEFCHLIIWVYYGDDERAHGPAFKKWMKKCGRRWGHLGVGEWEKFDVDDDDDTPLEMEPVCRAPHCQNLARQDDVILYEEQWCVDCQREQERKQKSKRRK